MIPKNFLKENLVLIIATVVIAAINVWLYTKNDGLQVGFIAFVLVWFDLVLSWITFRRQQAIGYIYLSAGLIIEILLAVNIFWISTRVL